MDAGPGGLRARIWLSLVGGRGDGGVWERDESELRARATGCELSDVAGDARRARRRERCRERRGGRGRLVGRRARARAGAGRGALAGRALRARSVLRRDRAMHEEVLDPGLLPVDVLVRARGRERSGRAARVRRHVRVTHEPERFPRRFGDDRAHLARRRARGSGGLTLRRARPSRPCDRRSAARRASAACRPWPWPS